MLGRLAPMASSRGHWGAGVACPRPHGLSFVFCPSHQALGSGSLAPCVVPPRGQPLAVTKKFRLAQTLFSLP